MPDVTPPGGGLDQSDILSDGTPFAGSDVGETLSELQSGRTRGLLMLLQDRPIPEIVDPLNIQSDLSQSFTQSGSDYIIGFALGSVVSRPDDDATQSNYDGLEFGLEVEPNQDLGGVVTTISTNTNYPNSGEIRLQDGDGNNIEVQSFSSISAGEEVRFDVALTSGNKYRLVISGPSSGDDMGANTNTAPPYGTDDIDITNGIHEGSTRYGEIFAFNDVQALTPSLTAQITDKYDAPTAPPVELQQWSRIRAEGVTTGGSTSADPVEFEILDSTDTVLNSARIPTSEMADSAFVLRDREYSEDADNDGQSDYQIPQTGDGGHYGIPIASVVIVSVAGNILDADNWTFDPTTNTVSIDTGNVTVSSGDTVMITYDFDVFDSTLQPRAHLSREDTSEDSPSISHFVYEYVI